MMTKNEEIEIDKSFFPSNLSPIESIVIIVKHENWFKFVIRFSLHSFPPIHSVDSNAQTKLTLIIVDLFLFSFRTDWVVGHILNIIQIGTD